MTKIVFMGIPSISGNYTHFKYLRNNIKHSQFYLLSLGNIPNVELKDEDYVNLGSHLDRKKQQKELSQLFLDFCAEKEVDVVIPMNSGIVASCIPLLKNAKVIQIVNSNTPRVYHYVTSLLEYSSKIICISQRQQNELIRLMSKDSFEDKITLIPHGVSDHPIPTVSAHQLPLTIGFLGRIHNGHKGVFKIPSILSYLSIPYQFEIVGDGQDKKKWLQDLQSKNISFTFHGFIPQDKIHQIINKWDILLFPSQVEGFPLTLIEAMSNGVVPLANHLAGITDFIITSGKDGFVIRKNRISDFISRIEQLDGDRELLCRMKQAARETVQQRFELSDIIKQYQQVFEKVLEAKKPGRIKDFSEWRPFVEYKPSILRRISNRIKIHQ
ncbi:glycosyltransferase family 4 protein [Lunatimonas salinarum]|uniref:glycosyltransferase family 4 protein n=1 Tax=Lunatimonas salinarum TaxID=1774590 RepID=UPI001AE0B080|nr:glycosyltransferase family 4 protein [Lunatimonas salinarum]